MGFFNLALLTKEFKANTCEEILKNNFDINHLVYTYSISHLVKVMTGARKRLAQCMDNAGVTYLSSF